MPENKRSLLIEKLQDIQRKQGFISDENMQNIADSLGIHPVEVFSVVTFYSFFSTRPKGKYIIRVSDCLPCLMKGSRQILKAFEDKLGIKCGQTTKDGRFTLEKTACIGMCDNAPAIMVNERPIGPVAIGDVDGLIKEFK